MKKIIFEGLPGVRKTTISKKLADLNYFIIKKRPFDPTSKNYSKHIITSLTIDNSDYIIDASPSLGHGYGKLMPAGTVSTSPLNKGEIAMIDIIREARYLIKIKKLFRATAIKYYGTRS